LQWTLKKWERDWVDRRSKTPSELCDLIVSMRQDAIKQGFKLSPDGAGDRCSPLTGDDYDIWKFMDRQMDLIGLDEEKMRKRQEELGIRGVTLKALATMPLM